MALAIALDECVEAVRRGEPLAASLARHPELREQLIPLVSLAIRLRVVGSSIRASHSFKEKTWRLISSYERRAE